MTVQPQPALPTDAEVSLVTVYVVKIISLLGLLGVAVPPMWQGLQAEQTIAFLLVGVGFWVWSLVLHLKTKAQLGAVKATLKYNARIIAPRA